uniref:CRIM domain-containing protein n=1 Tax=Syphacia muris TaxID=451379 RepID=A0A0N5AM75_9BILA
MAYFCPSDLIDAIRYEFGVEDETGVSMKVVPRPTRRSKPGGLPLNFRSDNASFSNDEEYSPNFFIHPEDLIPDTVTDTRIRSRTIDSDKSSAVGSVKCPNVIIPGTLPTEGCQQEAGFLQLREVPSAIECHQSLTMKLVRENTEVIDPNLASYAKFESTDPAQSRKLVVFFPFAEALPEEHYGCMLNVSVYSHTAVTDLIGLCCYVYMRNHRKPDISDPSLFQMLMAEDNGEVDEDLPAIDGHRLLSELGLCWSTVAVVPRLSTNSSGSDKTKIIVYTVNGAEYEFFLDSLDLSLRWLRDEALKRRKEIEGDSFVSEYPTLQEYVLEAIQRPNVALDLDATIGSTSCTDFLMLRKNSSRGSFQLSLGIQYDNSPPSLTPTAFSSGHHSPRFGSFGPENGSTCSLANDKVNIGLLIEEYSADRVHRYKPKSSTKLLFGKEGFEVKPDLSDRRRSVIFPVTFEKPITVLWNTVGTMDLGDHCGGKRSLKIVWVPLLESAFRSQLNGPCVFPSSSASSRTDSFDSLENEDFNKQQFSLINEKSRWKTLHLELSAEDACNFYSKASEILNSLQPQTMSLYKASAGGKRKPSVALEAVTNMSSRKSSNIKLPSRSSIGKPSPVPKVRGNKISRLAVSIQKIWNRDHS